MRWVRHHGATRRGALKDLLAHVRLPLLDPVYFLEKVETDQLIQGCKDCLPLLQEARRYHILGTEVSSVRCRPRRSMELAEAIVVIGGCDRKGLLKLPFVDALHPESKQWKPLPNVPGCAKSEFAACTLKNDIYISGGHVASREVWMLSSQLNVWIRVARLQKGRWRHKMASLQGKIYAVGGYDGVYRLSSVECYDPFSNSWAAVAPLLEAVSSPAVASCLHKLYVIGGATEDGANTEKVQCYDPQGNTWSLLSPAPFCQRCINAVTLDHVIYVAGGLLSAVFSYDPRSDAWREAALLPGPLESCGVTVCSGKIHILGGQDENGEGSDKAFALDVAAGVMEPQPPLQRCTSYHGCVTILRSTCR
uniref:Kelch like family member 35 n=1 Tax=Varanus komodoensis TaxID=61221 RepID=A0A8D2KSR1_VARKO